MFSRSNLLRTFLFISIVLMTAVASSAAAPNDQSTTSSSGVIHTYLMPDLSLKSVISVPELALPSGAGFRKTCRCSCGTGSCSTDADCGGAVGSCSHFISCCARGDKTQWFLGAEQSSRQTELPAFKSSCN
jgi:hypothetical protein